MHLDDIAHVRAGDKGDTLILAVRPRAAADLDDVVRAVTPARVAAHFGALATRPPRCRVYPGLGAVVVVLPGALGGGVTGSPTLDGHGKTLGYHLLGLPLP